jgi:hypothetical protein
LKHNYLELRRTKPRLKRLKEFLEEAPYSGDRYETEKSGHKVICEIQSLEAQSFTLIALISIVVEML